ncbi:MAG: GHKL domain-containing protein [Desulfobacterales bacterium]|nr:GHKL domain-containing protein [Desulfobacterales bacterium]
MSYPQNQNNSLSATEIMLQELNHEIDLLLYAISHDLRAPLRSIDGFTEALVEDYGDVLDDMGKDFLHRIKNAGKLLNRYIESALDVSRQTRGEILSESVDLTLIAHEILSNFQLSQPRTIKLIIQDNLIVHGDKKLLTTLLEKLLHNAWKFTSKSDNPEIEFSFYEEHNHQIFFVRDNGVGFDMDYASRRLFGLFQRMHSETEFEGMGTGLASARRIINRLGGRIWAEAKVNQGATFFFTLKL